jgi:hypothetical protein
MLLLHPAFRIVNFPTAKAKLHNGITETTHGNYRQVNLYMANRKPYFETGLCNHTVSLRFGLVYLFIHSVICNTGHVNYRLKFTAKLVIYGHAHNTI